MHHVVPIPTLHKVAFCVQYNTMCTDTTQYYYISHVLNLK